METHIIGIAGLATCGKDTVADLLAGFLGYDRYSIATPLKQMLEIGLGLVDKDPRAEELYDRNYRYLAQTLGTEWGRHIVVQDIWLRAAKHKLAGTHTVISDIRFENEAEYVRENGTLLHVVRLNHERIAENAHASEDGVQFKEGDITVLNGGTLEVLKYLCENIAHGLIEGEYP